MRRGDRVCHPKRPEWGTGVVERADAIVHEGTPAQRLLVTFPNHGRVTINTGVAPLLPASSAARPVSGDAFSTMKAPSSLHDSAEGGWLASIAKNARPKGSELWQLPASFSDPFVSDAQRLQTVLDSFRYGLDPRALIEWASAQTGLDDPLTKYTRHDLEQAYQRFARDRELHLREMVRQLKRQGQQALLERALATTRIPEARAALTRAIKA